MITTTKGILAVALLFWGWRTDNTLFAIPMAALLESTPFIRWRLAFDDEAMARVMDLTTLLWIGACLFLFIRYLNAPPLATHLYTLVSWSPMLLFPALLFQRLSAMGAFRMGHLFYRLRHSDQPWAHAPVQLETLYFLAMLLGASVVSQYGYWIGAGILLMWAIIVARPKRYRWFTTVGVLACAIAVAYPLGWGLRQAQSSLEGYITAWLEGIVWNIDPYRSQTMIGEVIDLKLSGRIMARISKPKGETGPWLLRKASFNVYSAGTWRAQDAPLRPLPLPKDAKTWPLATPTTSTDIPARPLEIAIDLPRGQGMLLLPEGTVRVEGLPVGAVDQNVLGAVKVKSGPGWVQYQAIRQGAQRDVPPTEWDSPLPRADAALLQQLVETHHLRGTTDQDTLARITRFLGAPFTYTLDLSAPKLGMTALETFLLHTRAGHCEYFATATVLLLRAAGVPARYATGFSVSEYSDLEKAYVARRRDGHAWTLAFVDGRWQDVDTTPVDWMAADQRGAPWWEPLQDFFSWLGEQWAQWRWRISTAEETDDHLIWWGLALLLTAVLFWRLVRKHPLGQHTVPDQPVRSDTPGAQSPFYAIIQAWSTQVGARPAGEALGMWLQRTGAHQQPMLCTMAALHQRWRFDPAGLSPEEQATLAAAVTTWLQEQASPKTS